MFSVLSLFLITRPLLQVFTPESCCKQSAVFAPPTLAPATATALKMYSTFAPTATCPYEKDPKLLCFNSFYPCLDCCLTGISPYFKTSCWDNTYTPERCCDIRTPGFTPPPPPTSTSTCADQEGICPSWAIAGECDGPSQNWVRAHVCTHIDMHVVCS